MNYYFDSSSEKAALLLSIRLKSIINTKKKPNQEIIILFSIQQMHFHIQSLLCVLAVTAQPATVLDLLLGTS